MRSMLINSFLTILSKQWARIYPKSMFIAVAGNLGRAETADYLKLVLGKKYRVLKTKQTSLLKVTPATKKVILEIDGEYNLTFTPPILIVNNLSKGSYEAKLVSKLPERSLLILNYDDINVRQLSEITSSRVVFYGSDPENCLIWLDNLQVEQFFTSFQLNHGVERVKIQLPLFNEYQIYPILAASTVGILDGMSLTSLKNTLNEIEASEHRLQPFLGFNNSVVLDDTLNCDPLLIEGSIETLMKIPARRHILVLSEIKDLGPLSEEVHRKIAQKIFREKVDLVFLGIGDANFTSDELTRLGFLKERMEANLQNQQIASKLLKVLMKGDICLVLGGLFSRFDEIVKRISKKS